MRVSLIGIAGAMLLAAPVAAQQPDGNTRHFYQNPFYESNGNGRIIYAPLVASHSGAARAGQPYSYPVADWAQIQPGARDRGPDSKIDNGTYRLERFDATHQGSSPVFHVVMTRRPAPPEGTAAPELRVLDQQSQISTVALGSVQTIDGGVQYTFLVRPPLLRLASATEGGNRATPGTYVLRLAPARDILRPHYFAGAWRSSLAPW